MAPQILRQASAAASSEALMRELGVLERAECQTAAKATDVKESPGASTDSDDAAVDVISLMGTSSLVLHVCQTGIRAQVPSVVILRHLWRPFSAAQAVTHSQLGALEDKSADEPLRAPTMEWAASLPVSVRELLLSHELQRVHRRRRYINRGVRGDVAVSTEEISHDTDRTPVYALSEMWTQTVQESRAVVLCCCAPWLLHHSTQASSVIESSEAASSLLRALFSPLERRVLEAGMRLCAVCQAEDVARALMAVFIRGVDSATSGASDQSRNIDALTEEGAFTAWYATEAGTLYESAMIAAAAPRTHAGLLASCTYFPTSGGFALAYSYLIHRGLAMARLAAASGEDRDNEEVPAAPEASSRSARSSRSWLSSFMQQPRCAMRLVCALAGAVDANADHFDVVLQLYLRLVEEAGAGYTADSVDDTRVALCAVLNALARVPLKTQVYLDFLEDVHRRTLVHSTIDVTEHPDVLASCLRVCSAARVPSRAVTLFNKLCEPSSRAIAAEERNVAAVLLSTPTAAMALQRLVSYMHTKLPVTADAVHAAAAQALIASTELVCSASSTMFAFFDLLELKVAAQHHVTSRTAAYYANRTFFLRLLTLLAGVHEQRCGGGALREALSTPAAAAVFRQWVASAVEHQPRTTSWASALPPVLVGVLQELALELHRAARADSQVGSDSFPAVPASSLLAAVEEVLHAAAGGLPTSVRPIGSVDEDTAKDCCTLYCLPEPLQWRQVQADWQLEEQRRFVEGASSLLQAPNADATAATSCLRYQDWAMLRDLQLRCASATSQEHLADAWANATSRGPKQPQPSASTSTWSRTPGGVAADRATLCVLTPLAEVEWWFMQDSASPSHALRMKTASLSETLGVAVPPAVGCPAHTWASEQAAAHGGARQRCTRVVKYWLQRWVDSVEDNRALPLHSVFRTSVVRVLQQSVSAVFVAEEKADAAEQDAELDTPSASSGEPWNASSPDVFSGRVKRSCVETMLVRGPSSVVYNT
ncbi:conserved hypothetical protein [Leishmania major strain Friedlin]|uniref:Uncharacterized protein n=1 Tax=Leishmania major TaxID=5664 RepID=E9AC82_LEIMA|nr:conserved hypothetical protein [Leishmania major strain Friedlin]CAG9567157.1 hypothetical_protein_-_conserved [Leishmania major strain Friedlin]CBZ11896.1 conserved hypothetical protein [Leishmania major strain Friedlin]|eukprot:XP_003721613.1 conserved hypothetical protein [Leishmania major strain Friedlin]